MMFEKINCSYIGYIKNIKISENLGRYQTKKSLNTKFAGFKEILLMMTLTPI